jgi:hypothetical protein
VFSTLCLAFVLANSAPLDVKPNTADKKHAAESAACVKACIECQIVCDSCYRHCAWKVLSGHKDHHAAMELCLGCSDACRFASALAARHSPLACHAVECCMKCCIDVAKECEKHPDDKMMAECAKACQDCAKICKQMTTQ